MADNSTEIARLQKLLDSGATSTTVDGQSVSIDPDKIRARLRELTADDDNATVKRPRASSIDLSGF